jgi:hypothetical protein
MANTPARKKPESGKKNKTVRTAKPARAKPAKNAGRITTSAKLPSGKAKHKATVKSGKLHRGKSKGLHKAPDPQTKMRAG